MAKLFNPFFQAIDGNGAPLSGAKLNFYITGTTTRKNTYSNADLDVSHLNANPVVADSNGRFGPIYLDTDVDYKAILTDSAGSTVSNGTLDPLLYRTSDSVISAQGDLIVGDATGAEVRLPINANADATLRSTGVTPEWRRSAFTKQVFTSGSGTWTKPANCTAIRVRVLAGGGGGGGVGASTGPTGATGGTSSFNSVTAIGGTGGLGNTTGTPLVGAGGIGGTGGTGTASFRIAGGQGGNAGDTATGKGPGGSGGNGGPGAPEAVGATGAGSAGIAAGSNTGGGGGPASSQGTTSPASAGGGGEYFELHISLPSASYTYAVGGGGAGGIGTGTGAETGGAGGSGIVIVEEYYW